MRKQTFTPPSSGRLLRLLLFLFLSVSVTFWGCDKAEDAAVPGATATLSAANQQTAKAGGDVDDKYKTDKTGQYVSKDVQVTGYEDGSERPTRPKYDSADGSIGTYSEPPCTDCGVGGGGTVTSPTVITGTSQQIGGYGTYTVSDPSYNNAIFDLKVIKGNSSSIGTSDFPGYYKIPVDLNKGAGGKYIYLIFTRDPSKVRGDQDWVNSTTVGRNKPVRDLWIESMAYFAVRPDHTDGGYAPLEEKDALSGYHLADLNDGAGGDYIFAHQYKGGGTTVPVIREIGVIASTSSSVQAPAGWSKLGATDLNKGAGGYYIYFIYKQ